MVNVYVAGIDEAGRGPVLGPMVMAIAVVNINDLDLLKEMGVKDSKLLTPKKREELYPEIKKLVNEYHSIKIDAKDIDKQREKYSLNLIEAKISSELINKLETTPRKIYVDCPDTNPRKYQEIVYSYLEKNHNLVVEHHADLNYVVVSCASIIAKVDRDNYIKDLETKVGTKIGSGYPGDPITKEFLKEVVRMGKVPDFVRKSWQTYIDAKDGLKQKKLI